MYHYPARFERDRHSGSYTVTFPDFGWGVTQGDDLHDAIEMARDLLRTLLDYTMKHQEALPNPSKMRGKGYRAIGLRALEEAKVALYAAVQEAGLRNGELARKLRQPVTQVNRLLDLNRSSNIEEIEAAFAVLGKSIGIEVRSAA
jgi:predicted RNase H-like HicB family nuclease